MSPADTRPPQLIDSDILIWHLRNRLGPLVVFDRARARGPLQVAAMQRSEVMFYLKRGEERGARALMSILETVALTEEMVDLGADLFRRYSPSHGTDVNDALLAATAMLTNGKIITQNTRHFPMPGLDVERGWA